MTSPNVAPYAALITSEHNSKPNFMAVVDIVVGAAADAVAAANAIQPAFNLNQAVGAQLDVIGQWVGQARTISNVLTTGYFGFSELSSGLPDGLQEPFGELTNVSIGGKWYELGAIDSASATLADPEYLTILKARITRNQSNGTLSAIENALQFIFGAGCAVQDLGTYTLNLFVNMPVTPLEEALLTALDILPRPYGISIGSITYNAGAPIASPDSGSIDPLILFTDEGEEYSIMLLPSAEVNLSV